MSKGPLRTKLDEQMARQAKIARLGRVGYRLEMAGPKEWIPYYRATPMFQRPLPNKTAAWDAIIRFVASIQGGGIAP